MGPMFNATSCVACHHQGGVGGGGDNRFNGRSVGIERIDIEGFGSERQVAELVRRFHPGFVTPDGGLTAAVTLNHFGGSTAADRLRNHAARVQEGDAPAEGGWADAADVRGDVDQPRVYHAQDGALRIAIHYRFFGRNTTSLFGAGTLDRIDDDTIIALAKAQRRHPEISGRVSVLENGRLGKFGWRANRSSLATFCVQACGAELGLQSEHFDQAADAERPAYRNTGIDIGDAQVQQLVSFVRALPTPTPAVVTLRREAAESSDAADHWHTVRRGAAAFASVGCAVCHVPDVGPARGIYSDLLLHDMGPNLYDFEGAQPKLKRQQYLTSREVLGGTTTTTRTTPAMDSTYYGRSVSIPARTTTQTESFGGGSTIRGGSPSASSEFAIAGRSSRVTPRGEAGRRTVEELARGQVRQIVQREKNEDGDDVTRRSRVQEVAYLERVTEPSMVTQEWRTPPLWGVADTAPYLHDGRAGTLLEAIVQHGGESAATTERYLNLPVEDRDAVIAFLQTMRGPDPIGDDPQR